MNILSISFSFALSIILQKRDTISPSVFSSSLFRLFYLDEALLAVFFSTLALISAVFFFALVFVSVTFFLAVVLASSAFFLALALVSEAFFLTAAFFLAAAFFFVDFLIVSAITSALPESPSILLPTQILQYW